MIKKSLKIGFAPTRRNVFDRAAAGLQKTLIEAKLREWGVDYVGLDWLNDEGLIFDPVDVRKVAEHFKSKGVDAVFAPHCNFGTEAAVGLLGRAMGKPLLLWGPRDEGPDADGNRQRDTQCGLFATSKALRRANVPFTYIVNSAVDSVVFERGFHLFLGAAAAAKAFLGARVGQVGTRPAPFWTTMYNEGELLERWGIQVVPTTLVELTRDVLERVEKNSPELRDTIIGMKQHADFSGVPDEQMARLAGLKLALLNFVHTSELDALCIQCWSALQTALRIRTCYINAELTDMGLPVACETDVHGALTSLLVQAGGLYTTPPFFADLTIRHPSNNNAELLWHCGCFPPSLAIDETQRGVETFPPSVPMADRVLGVAAPRYTPAAGRWQIRGGEITLARFDGDQGRFSLLIGRARGTEGPHTHGTYVWIEVDNWPKWEERFVYGPYIHHCVGIHAPVAPILYEACKYIPGLTPDVLDPSESEIRAFWRGEDL